MTRLARALSLAFALALAWALAVAAPARAADPYATLCAFKTWASFLAPGPQTPIPVEEIELGNGRSILVFRFAELKGPRGKLFVFLLDDGTCFRRVVSIGSYDATAAMKPEGPRLYHADLYEEGRHGTLGFFDGPPDYAAMRAKALDILK